MDSGNLDYAAWAQVAVAIIAVIAASFPLTNFITRRFLTIRAQCLPVGKIAGDLSVLWDVELRNRSRLFGGFSIFVFPATERNHVMGFQQVSPNDGGMVVAPEIVEGALEVKVVRFHKQRVLKIRIQFQRPDVPSFNAGNVRLVKRLSSPLVGGAEIVLALTYQRLMLMMLVFFGVTLIIVAAMIKGMWKYV